MRTRDVMTKDPITIDSEALILDARRIMKEKNIRRLPVVDKGKLVGIITKHDIDEAAPPPTTVTGAYEFHHLLTDTKVKEVMKTDLVTVSPDLPFEEILNIVQKKKISSFPVVEDGKLIGITTESDVVRFLIRVLGLNEEGSRITIEGLSGKLGADLKEIISIVDNHKMVILSMLSLQRPEKNDWMIMIRLRTKNPDEVVEDLKEKGFNVTYVA